jgi:Na+/proline symporter
MAGRDLGVFVVGMAMFSSTLSGFGFVGGPGLVYSMGMSSVWIVIPATIGIALVATAFALYSHYQNERLIALLGAFGWGTFAAALVPTVAIGFNWKRASAPAANVAIVVSLVVKFGVELFDIAIPYGIHGGTVFLVLSIVLFFGISWMLPAPRLDPDIEAVMDV